VNQDVLRAELDQVTSELGAAETEYASLGAKVAGLAARQSALRKALQSTDLGVGVVPAPVSGYRTDAIVAVLAKGSSALSIKEVVAELRGNGRPDETYNNVSADLAYLAEKGRVARVKRGIYATAIQHRSVQTCPAGHKFLWQPAPGSCPYCVLTSEERIAGLQQTEASTPCPPDCCPLHRLEGTRRSPLTITLSSHHLYEDVMTRGRSVDRVGRGNGRDERFECIGPCYLCR
jgi:hypothetical protein